MGGDIDRLAITRGIAAAGQHRLEIARNIASAVEVEKSLAKDRIESVNVADATADLVRGQILSNAQVALMAQAGRLVPAIALQLLDAA